MNISEKVNVLKNKNKHTHLNNMLKQSKNTEYFEYN